METNSVLSNNITKGQHVLKIAEGLGQILVALHTFLVLIEMNPCLNIQIDNNRTGKI